MSRIASSVNISINHENQGDKANTFQQQKRSVLIAHADLSQRSVLELSFISDGFEVAAVETGKAALKYLQDNTPDIMILDAHMPRLTGMDVCSRAKRVKRLEHIPVIIMTATIDDKTELMIKMCHADDFFPRGLKNIELKAKVRKLLERPKP
ncbi:MAG: response regulator [Deinococcales bacterium]